MRPLPVSVIQALDTSAQGTTARKIAISDLTWVAFFFLLHPGEYCKGGTDTAQNPFRLKDVQLFIGQQPYIAATASTAVLAQSDFVRLLFTTQKNFVKGESNGNGRNVHHQGCPVAAMCCRVAYLRHHGATSDTPISSFKKATKWKQIRVGRHHRRHQSRCLIGRTSNQVHRGRHHRTLPTSRRDHGSPHGTGGWRSDIC